MIEWLKDCFEGKNHLNDDLYSLDKLLDSAFEVRKLGDSEAYIILNKKEDYWLNFAVLEFAESESDDTNTMLSVVFYGGGNHWWPKGV